MSVNNGFVDVFRKQDTVEQVNTISPLIFLKDYVMKSRPVLLVGYASKWDATKLWTDDYLIKKIGKKRANVEVSKTLIFSGDHKKKKKQAMMMKKFLTLYNKPNRNGINYYVAEKSFAGLTPIRKDFPMKPHLITPHYIHDRTQLWMGAGGQTTPMHNDMQDNILCQIVGTRHVRLYDPMQTDLLNTDPKNPVYSRVDPTNTMNTTNHPLFKYATGITAQIQAGDCLFIPSSWYHLVKSGESRNIAVNWWYISASEVSDFTTLSMATHMLRDVNKMRPKKH
jgi:ribosomal protein L16 Arg81 hydroxylase